MDDRYLAIYRDLFEGHWWWRARRKILLSEIERILAGAGPQRILDVGCGDGLFFPYLRPFGEIEGVEPESALVTDRAQRWGPIHAVPFDKRFQPGKRFTLILFLDVLEHLDDPRSALQQAARLLESDGRILITLPAFRILWTTHDDMNEHRARYTRASLGHLASQSGIKLTDHKYLFHWLFPVKLGVRLVESLGLSRGSPPGIPPGPVNDFLTAISVFEYRALRGFRLPFGSTLLAVGQKPGSAASPLGNSAPDG